MPSPRRRVRRCRVAVLTLGLGVFFVPRQSFAQG
jgi:hypothetical protein